MRDLGFWDLGFWDLGFWDLGNWEKLGSRAERLGGCSPPNPRQGTLSSPTTPTKYRIGAAPEIGYGVAGLHSIVCVATDLSQVSGLASRRDPSNTPQSEAELGHLQIAKHQGVVGDEFRPLPGVWGQAPPRKTRFSAQIPAYQISAYQISAHLALTFKLAGCPKSPISSTPRGFALKCRRIL